MDSNNEKNPFDKYSVFSTSQFEKDMSEENQVPESNLSQQQILTVEELTKQVLQNVNTTLSNELGDKGVNLINQRKVIETQSQEKLELEKKLKEAQEAREHLEKQLNELRSSMSGETNTVKNNDLEYLKNQLKSLQEYQLQQKLTPIIQYMESQGIEKKDIPTILQTIQKKYKSDFFINPDKDLVEFVIGKEKKITSDQPNYTIPKGSYSPSYTNNNDQFYQQQVAEQLKLKEEEIKKRVEERKRRAQIV